MENKKPTHREVFNWVPPNHKTQYKKWIKNIYSTTGSSKEFRERIEKFKKSGKPGFDEWFDGFIQSAYRIKTYMDFRAYHEKQKHEFDEFFYLKSFQQGCFNFFGIECCPGCGQILKDKQNPVALEWFEEFENKEIEKSKPSVH